MLHREPVSSSVIAAIGYDEEAETLEVEFVSGAVCRYLGVEPDVYEDFRSASSKGKFFNRHIRDAYPWESVER
jgi:KTSC domain-containing protein